MLNYMPQLPPAVMNRFTDGTPARAAQSFPANLAANLPPETQQKILLWLSTKYIWPQIQERMPFEDMWKKMLQMARIELPEGELFSNTQHDTDRTKNAAEQSNRDKARVSDSVVHDAIERLTDITAFIAFKDGLPCQFAKPDYIKCPYNTPEYKPLEDRIQAGNALLEWNSGNQNLKRNSVIAYRHHYTYGLAYVLSDFRFRVEMINRQDNQGNLVPNPEITEIGTTFEPISIRKLWLNWRLPAYDMDAQPCPFFFDETPRFAIMQNEYHPQLNPFGYANLHRAMAEDYLYSASEMGAVRDAFSINHKMMVDAGGSSAIAQILEPKHSVEAKWTLYPMMPLDPQTGEFETRADGTLVPYQRFIVETFGSNVHSGSQNILRIQENYFPGRHLPLYASCHMPDLDSGLYAPSIGQLLYNHYKEITLCMEQYLENKDLINNPPVWVTTACPSMNEDFNKKGGKIKVNGPNDFGWRTIPDGTQSTVAMMQMLRDNAQTTSKAVDAILGKAMGSRTSATEASNAFQASMSAITTDIDLLSTDLHGAYAHRVWDYTGLWFDPDLLKTITGQFGFAIDPQDMWTNIGVKTNVGSTYVEKIVKQQNNRYILESSRGEIGLNRAELWRELLEDMGFDADRIVDDGGRDQQIQLATSQTCETYLGYPVMVDPDQDHQIAIKVKTAFLKDRSSVWNVKFPQGAQGIMQQIEQHQYFVQLQMQMQLAQQQMLVAQEQLKIHQENPPPILSESGAQTRGAPPASTAGQIAQQGASAR